MISGVFSVRDKAVDCFTPPFYARTKGEAIRSFTQAVGTPDHQFAKHKGDYDLYSLGTFDDVSGLFSSDVDRILSGLEVVLD